ncbi:COP9 signalosome complex subunit 7-like [Teratosphaeria destructans]|uniref:COP9 signalosome complex subunit 7-like n=1 Tax=Teratosphaeria destructans TaxID=418781 RepID=A0A9W7SMJ7_9PEZI|nr:COP9 signalosome complex subunit 7-like [Teratosphaeria destructans]
MEQSRALNALAPFLALAKSATSPRAAADLISQATSAPNTYVFAELLQQPNIQSLEGNEQYGASHDLLKTFAWGTWESYKGNRSSPLHPLTWSLTQDTASPNLPQLSHAQSLKLRLLSLLTIASQKQQLSSSECNLSYSSLQRRLDLASSLDLEHLVTQAIYSDLISATLNPAAQIVVITSVAPLRDLAPGSVNDMVAELAAWSGRCDSALADLEAEIAKIKSDARRRAMREQRTEKQVKAVTDEPKNGGVGTGLGLGGVGSLAGMGGKSGHNTRGAGKKPDLTEDGDDEDAMEVDGGEGAGRRKSNVGKFVDKLSRKGSK